MGRWLGSCYHEQGTEVSGVGGSGLSIPLVSGTEVPATFGDERID